MEFFQSFFFFFLSYYSFEFSSLSRTRDSSRIRPILFSSSDKRRSISCSFSIHRLVILSFFFFFPPSQRVINTVRLITRVIGVTAKKRISRRYSRSRPSNEKFALDKIISKIVPFSNDINDKGKILHELYISKWKRILRHRLWRINETWKNDSKKFSKVYIDTN